MFYGFVFLFIFWSILLIFYFSQKSGFSYRNGKILLTTIPVNAVNDEDVQSIRKNALRSFKILHLLFFLISFILFFIKSDLCVIYFIFFIIAYIISESILCNKYIKKMRKLKKEKNFTSFTRKYIDMSITKEINNQKIPLFFWTIPLIIFILGYCIFGKFSGIEFYTFIFLILNLFGIIFIGLTSKKFNIMIVSEDREKNLYINELRIIRFQNKIFNLSNFYSFLFLILIFFVKIDQYSIIPYFLFIILMILFVFYVIFLSNNIEKELSSSIEDDKFIEDQDEYYDIFGYKNPNDNRILVNDPMNPMNTILNRGNKKGKILLIIVNVIVAFVIILSLLLVFEKGWEVEISDSVKISTTLYKDNINFNDIESIELFDKFPDKRIVRIYGTATIEKAYGTFNMEGEGTVRLYIFKNVSKVIKIERKNGKNIYFNMKTNEETEKVFENLKIKK